MNVGEPKPRVTLSGAIPAKSPEAPYEIRVTDVGILHNEGHVFDEICKERGWILVGWDDAPADGYRLYVRHPNTLEIMEASIV